MASKLVTYVPRPMPTLDGGDQLYLQQELASIAGSIKTSNTAIQADEDDIATNTTNIATNTTAITTLTTKTTGYESAWTAYTPTITAASGAFTLVSATGAYKTVGKTVFLRISVTITSNGTAAGFVAASLPVAAIGTLSAILPGREVAVVGKALMAQPYPSASQLAILNYDNTYPGGSGYVLVVTGVYESV